MCRAAMRSESSRMLVAAPWRRRDRPPWRKSDAAIPEVAIAFNIERKVLGVAREILVLGQFDLGDRARIALVFFGGLLHGGGKVEHIVEVGLDVVLVADLPAAGAGVPGDQPVPIHGQDLLHALLLIRQKVSAMMRNWVPDNGRKSTTKMIFSFGRRMMSELSPWFLPR